MKVWTDNWICTSSDLKPAGPILPQHQNLLVSDLLSRETKEWNEALINDLLPTLSEHITSIRPSFLGAKDAFIWTQNSSGIYSARSGYHSIRKTKVQSTIRLLDDDAGDNEDAWNWNRNVWVPPLPPKVKLFIWKCARDALPTGDNLLRRNIRHNTNCVRCGAPKNLLHILFHCPFAVDTWSRSFWASSWDSTLVTSFQQELQTSRRRVALPPLGVTTNLLPWICWNLWLSRNQLVFESKVQSQQQVFNKAITSCKEWETAQSTSAVARSAVSANPTPPSLHANLILCFTDAAWRVDHKAAGLAWIFLNRDLTEISRGSSFQTAVSSPLMAEALATRGALLHASASDLNMIWLRSDSQGLIKAITSNLRSIELYGVLSDVDLIISSASLSVSFSFVPRSSNGLADALAENCLSLNLSRMDL